MPANISVKSTHKHFDSLSAYVAWAKNLDASGQGYKGQEWHPKAHLEAYEPMLNGREDLIVKAQEIIDQLEIDDLETIRPHWQNSVMGAYPIVPSYLAGMPESMRRLTHQPTETDPIRIWVGVTSSAGVSEEQLLQRGIALTAFAMALGQIRQVSITPYVLLGRRRSHYHNAYVSWDLATSPVNLSEVAANMADPKIIRWMGIWACAQLNHNVDGAWTYKFDDPAYMRGILGCAADDIYLGGIHMSDPLLVNPVRWIKENLSKYNQED